MGLQCADDRACGFPQSTHVVGDLDGGPLPVHVDDDHDPGPMAGHDDAHRGRAIVQVQAQRDRAAEYRDRWLRDLRRSAPPRCGPWRAARLPRPARQPPSRSMPAVDRIPTNERLGDPRLHGRNAGTPRGTTGLLAYSWRGAARRRDCAPRPADRAERRLPDALGRIDRAIDGVVMLQIATWRSVDVEATAGRSTGWIGRGHLIRRSRSIARLAPMRARPPDLARRHGRSGRANRAPC